mmetsp:Transcript_25322/g.48383  ORF Transcript_25322/g.48383 Transcript_25322/m.48383 type:complete len:420 (-) Transcript_25322:550-1809(-)
MLESSWIPARDRHCRSVHVKLPHDGRRHLRYLRPKRHRTRLPQPQQPDQNILQRILVRQKRLPPSVRHVIPPYQLHVVRTHRLLYLLHPHLPRPNILARQVQIPHPRQRQLAEIAVLHPARHQRHGNIALDAVHPRPGGYHGHDAGGEFHELIGSVIPVPSRLPQFVQTRAAYDQCGVELEAVGAEGGILEEFAEAGEIPFESRVGKVGHHVRDDLESAVLREVEGGGDGADGVSPIGLAGDRFVYALHSDFDPRAAVSQHFAEVRLETVVRTRLERDADALDRALLRVAHGLLDARRFMTGQRIVQIANEVILVTLVETHEGAPHDDEFDLVDRVSQSAELRHPSPRLGVGIVPRADGAHARGFVSRVGLRRVLEVAVGSAGAVDADSSRHGDVGTAMGFAHYRDYGDAARRSDRLLT